MTGLFILFPSCNSPHLFLQVTVWPTVCLWHLWWEKVLWCIQFDLKQSIHHQDWAHLCIIRNIAPSSHQILLSFSIHRTLFSQVGNWFQRNYSGRLCASPHSCTGTRQPLSFTKFAGLKKKTLKCNTSGWFRDFFSVFAASFISGVCDQLYTPEFSLICQIVLLPESCSPALSLFYVLFLLAARRCFLVDFVYFLKRSNLVNLAFFF